MASSSSSSASFVGRGSSPSSSWPKMKLPDESYIHESQQSSNTHVYGVMNYVSPSTTLISTRRDLQGSDDGLDGAEFVPSTVTVWNGRNLIKTLHTSGFELVPSDISSLDVDFINQTDVVENYYPHVEEFLTSFLTKNDNLKNVQVVVVAFDHNVRSNQGAGKTRIKNGGSATVQNPAGLVHADYTKISAPRRLEQLGETTRSINDVRQQSSMLDSNAVQEALSGKRRFAFINVWRNIAKEPVQQMPLACIDATTVDTATDLRTFQIHYADRVGENYLCCPSPQHTWCYFPLMTRNEALLLKQWDSSGDVARGNDADRDLSTMTVHSAFMDPTSLPDAPPRESIEVRCVVIWDETE